ncbi:MAG TPA: hypothetical protein VF787_04390 [Thermoanaerobaculia bacterium]
MAIFEPDDGRHFAQVSSRLYELNDRALWPLIEAADDRSQEAAIETLVVEDVKPVIASILERFRRTEPNLRNEDLEEIGSLAAVRLIRKVRAAAIYEEHAIKVLSDYLATLTYNALYDFRRQRYPERHRLKRNLRYLLTRNPAFALWETPECVVAGLSVWKGQPSKLTVAPAASSIMRNKARPVDAIQALLKSVGHPIAFDTLVDFVAELWGVREAVVESGEYPPDERNDQLSALEQREYFATLWSEIRELPDAQRAALLLNLRDSGGSNALTLFLVLNIASAAEVARVVGVSEGELNELWERLPLDDLTIADRLKLTRQQVINLRKSARMRLARRMAKWK